MQGSVGLPNNARPWLSLDPLSEVVESEMTHLAAIWISSKREGDLSSSRRCLLLHLEVTPELKSSEGAATPTANDLFVSADLEPSDGGSGPKHPAPIRNTGARRVQ